MCVLCCVGVGRLGEGADGTSPQDFERRLVRDLHQQVEHHRLPGIPVADFVVRHHLQCEPGRLSTLPLERLLRASNYQVREHTAPLSSSGL